MTRESRPHLVTDLTRQQYPEASRVLAAAFVDDPVMRSLLRGLSSFEMEKRLQVMFAACLDAAASRNLPWGIGLGKRIDGVAVVHRPGTYPPSSWTQLAIIARVVKTNGFHGVGRFLKWAAALDRHRPPTPHYYLEVLGVDPLHQGLGGGSALLRELAARADRAGVGCRLETANPRNVPVYERHGFRPVARQTIIDVDVVFMWRNPT